MHIARNEITEHEIARKRDLEFQRKKSQLWNMMDKEWS